MIYIKYYDREVGMSLLFTSCKLGDVEVANRFIHSATTESMAEGDGGVSDGMIKRYRNLAANKVGLIIPGAMYVQPSGRHFKLATGIHNDSMIPGLRRLVEAVHEQGGKIFFQLNHAGRQTTRDIIGKKPMGPSAKYRDHAYLVKPRDMRKEEILETIGAFGAAAGRAAEAGAGGVPGHAAHGY